jgi:hypothetical protein
MELNYTTDYWLTTINTYINFYKKKKNYHVPDLMKKVSSETWHEYLIKYLIFIVNDKIFWLMAHIHGMNKNIFRINF